MFFGLFDNAVWMLRFKAFNELFFVLFDNTVWMLRFFNE